MCWGVRQENTQREETHVRSAERRRQTETEGERETPPSDHGHLTGRPYTLGRRTERRAAEPRAGGIDDGFYEEGGGRA